MCQKEQRMKTKGWNEDDDDDDDDDNDDDAQTWSKNGVNGRRKMQTKKASARE